MCFSSGKRLLQTISALKTELVRVSNAVETTRTPANGIPRKGRFDAVLEGLCKRIACDHTHLPRVISDTLTQMQSWRDTATERHAEVFRQPLQDLNASFDGRYMYGAESVPLHGYKPHEILGAGVPLLRPRQPMRLPYTPRGDRMFRCGHDSDVSHVLVQTTACSPFSLVLYSVLFSCVYLCL